jgi:magnesium-transporting ATPase (P-type)
MFTLTHPHVHCYLDYLFSIHLQVLPILHILALDIIRTFDFVSSPRRMSVLVKKLRRTSVEDSVKGAREVKDMWDKETGER